MKNSFNKIVFISLFLFSGTVVFGQTRIIDSLLKMLKTAKEDTFKVKILNDLSKKTRNIGDMEKAMKYAKYANSLSEKLNYRRGLYYSYNHFALIQFNLGNYSESLKNYALALSASKGSGDRRFEAYQLIGIGAVHDVRGHYPEAIKSYFEALKLNEELKDDLGIAACYNNIAFVYQKQGDYDEAEKNYNRSIELAKKLKNDKWVANAYGNVGHLLRLRAEIEEDPEKKEQLLSESLKRIYWCLKLYNEMGDRSGAANAYQALGLHYQLLKDYNRSALYNDTALALSEAVGDKLGVVQAKISLANICLFQKQFRKAKDKYEAALALAKNIESKYNLQECYGGLATAYSELGDSRRTLEYHKLYVAYRDSILNDDNTRRSMESAMQYEFDKKESEVRAEQSKKDAVAKAEKKRQKMILALVCIVLLLVLVFVYFVIKSLRSTRRQKFEIEEQKKLVEEKQKEILDSIHYARKIQLAQIPSEKRISAMLKRSQSPEAK
jgi:tetratricopeptide (TPR) repeat protein